MPLDRCDRDPLSLHPEVERWAREQGWASLRPFQDEARQLILGSNCDLIITASTSAGKSEAALLPLLTLAAARTSGVSVLCLSPNKALINDQVRRLEVLASRLGVPIYAWHGDAPPSGKKKLVRHGLGIVIMTIESLEGRMVRLPRMIEDLFSNLDAVVIDELHEFLDGPRGAQLSSLLARLDEITHRVNRRIALSATIADPASARRWMRMQDPRAVRLVKGPADLKTVKSKIRGYVAPPPRRATSAGALMRTSVPPALRDIESSLFRRLRSGTHIVFARSRANVEALSDGLARRCSLMQAHNPFVPHHGSMSKHGREDVENRLRSGEELTAITTTTLGTGIDIGTVDSVEIIGAPGSLTALRQYIGRSGRRDAPAAVSLHVTELPRASAIKLYDRLRLSTVRACAALNLLEQRFFEPPADDGTALTVVIQQVLSMLKQRSGALFSELLRSIQSVAAFRMVTEKMLRQILSHLLSSEEAFIEQASDGRFILTQKGEKLVHGKEFYASFRTTDQWDVVTKDERKLGQWSFSNDLAVGKAYLLGGNPWEVTRLDFRHYRATVVPALAGSIPTFDPTPVADIHEQLALEMRRVLESDIVQANELDGTAARHVAEGRNTYKDLDLGRRSLVQNGDLCHLMSWKGTRFNKLLGEVLRSEGFVCRADEAGVTVFAPEALKLAKALEGELPTVTELSKNVGAILYGKYDRHVPEQLLRAYWASRHAALEGDLHEFCHTAARELAAV